MPALPPQATAAVHAAAPDTADYVVLDHGRPAAGLPHARPVRGGGDRARVAGRAVADGVGRATYCTRKATYDNDTGPELSCLRELEQANARLEHMPRPAADLPVT